ncbi:MAG: cyclic nucleotide-binding domain-containing protein [Leptolyngbyaceae cyanobacterium CSU_1_3]|nr:cyclic nucleotide-binding domain-containing protein [Leptolyngbyaceae cyanobacterium CSU_1_3]
MKKVLFILGELIEEDIDWLVEIGDRQLIPPAMVLIQEGRCVETLYILLEGELSVLAQSLGGREIARLNRGEIVGEMSFVDSRPPSATVRAAQASQVFAIPQAQLAAKLDRDVGFASRFYRALAMFLSNRLRSTVGQLGDRKETTLDLNDSSKLAQSRLESLLRRLQEK